MELSLECKCGSVIRVSSAQCGSLAKCHCGESTRVPALRELVQLQPSDANNANQTHLGVSDDPDELLGAIRVAVAHRGIILVIAVQICFGVGLRILAQFNLEQYLSIRLCALLLCIMLAFYIFRVLIVVGNLATAVILGLFAFVPFLNLAAALAASLVASRHLKRFGYKTTFWGLSAAEIKELQSHYRRTSGPNMAHH